MSETIDPSTSQDTSMEIGRTAAELYAKHKEVGEAEAQAGDAYREALDAERTGEGPATVTAEAGSAYRAAGTANAQSLEASSGHFKANQAAYVAGATEEARAVGNEIDGPVVIAKHVEPFPDKQG